MTEGTPAGAWAAAFGSATPVSSSFVVATASEELLDIGRIDPVVAAQHVLRKQRDRDVEALAEAQAALSAELRYEAEVAAKAAAAARAAPTKPVPATAAAAPPAAPSAVAATAAAAAASAHLTKLFVASLPSSTSTPTKAAPMNSAPASSPATKAKGRRKGKRSPATPQTAAPPKAMKTSPATAAGAGARARSAGRAAPAQTAAAGSSLSVPIDGATAKKNAAATSPRNAQAAGHTLRPSEMGMKVRVCGDGWGGGDRRRKFEGTVTEADKFTFTVVYEDGAGKWTETHVLREHCALVPGSVEGTDGSGRGGKRQRT